MSLFVLSFLGSDHLLKLLLVGDHGVGKTSLILQFTVCVMIIIICPHITVQSYRSLQNIHFCLPGNWLRLHAYIAGIS